MFTASIVIYNNDKNTLHKAVNSLLRSPFLEKLFLIDNSRTDKFKDISTDNRVIYQYNNMNLGFGKAHNLALKQAMALGAEYHFVVNPDIYFEGNVLEEMVNLMKADPKIGLMMPKILNLDGSIQFLPKFPPSPPYLLWRKIQFPRKPFEKFIALYELRNAPPDMTYIAPRVSGCFSLLNLAVIKEIGLYDERFFMYFEDSDLSRRVYQRYKTIYFPGVSVYHGYENGASKNFKLFLLFIHSAIKYFNKWGWFFDKERKEINERTVEQFENLR